MRSVFLPLALLFLLPGAAPVQAETCTLDVHIRGLRNTKGFAAAVIFSSAEGWPEQEDKAYAKDAVPVTGPTATISVPLPPGKYAVAVLHDENDNHKLDRNMLNIPTEGFGFANNPTVFFTAPSFQRAEINVGCPVTDINVKMIYK
jgi:uncharacterized protein (DUF2141 family)